MERRGCGLGCIFIVLGLGLSCCLLPYLTSSLYAILSAVLRVPGTPGWLWGDLLNELVASDSPVYMLLAEGPICCVGTLSLLIVILGAVLLIMSFGQAGEPPLAEEEYPPYEPPEPHYGYPEQRARGYEDYPTQTWSTQPGEYRERWEERR